MFQLEAEALPLSKTNKQTNKKPQQQQQNYNNREKYKEKKEEKNIYIEYWFFWNSV